MMTDQLMGRLRRCRAFHEAVQTILNDTVALHGAEYGDLQLLDGDTLLIVAQRNLTPEFLKTFREVTVAEASACGRALGACATVVVEDVEKDSEYADFREAARQARYRSVQTTPLCTSGGRIIGMVSTLFVNPHLPTKIELATLDKYSVAAADYLFELLDGKELGSEARRMNKLIYECTTELSL